MEGKHDHIRPNHIEIDSNEVIERFEEVKDLLTWEQWNFLFCAIEKETNKQRAKRPKKYNKL